MSDPTMNYSGITMTVPYQTFEAMKRQIDSLTAENQDLKNQDRLPTGSASNETRDLRAALFAALPVVQFAVANLPPEAIRGWPHKELDALGRHLAKIAKDPRLVELAKTLCYQAEHQADVDDFRAKRVADAKDLFGMDDESVASGGGSVEGTEDVDTRPG